MARRRSAADAARARRVEQLAGVPLFEGLPPEELDALADACAELCVRKGETLCREGEPGDTLYLVLDGELEVWTGEGRGRLVGRVGPGELVGEMTLLLGGARTATVQAARRTTLLALGKAAFDRFVGRNPRALEYLSRILCQRLLTTSRNETAARPATVVGVVAAPGLRGRTFVASALAGLLRDLTARAVLSLRIVPEESGRRRHERPPLAGDLKRESTERVLGRVAAGGGMAGGSVAAGGDAAGGRDDPAELTVAVRPGDDAQRVADDLGSLLGRLATAFPLVVVDPRGDLAAAGEAVAQVAHEVVEIVAHAEPGEGRDERSGTRVLRVVSLVNPGAGSIPISHCEPFVIPLDPALGELDPAARSRAIRAGTGAPAARPLHRLARKILGASVGVALGGGAAFGLAHVGVFRALEEHGVPIDLVAGASMGSIFALAYAAGLGAGEMAEIVHRIGTRRTVLSALDFTLTRPSFLAGERLASVLSPLFGEARTFADLRLPCRTVAADIEAGARVAIGTGDLLPAFRASCAVPMVWPPVRHQGRILVDGSVIDPVPAEVVHEMGADLCIAVNVVPRPRPGVTTVLSRLYGALNRLNPLAYLGGSRDLPNMFDNVMSSFQTLQHELGHFKAISADVRINPDLSDLTWIEFYRAAELIERGRAAAERAVPEIRRLLARRLGTAAGARPPGEAASAAGAVEGAAAAVDPLAGAAT